MEKKIREALGACFKAEGINVTSTFKAADLCSAQSFTCDFLEVLAYE